MYWPLYSRLSLLLAKPNLSLWIYFDKKVTLDRNYSIVLWLRRKEQFDLRWKQKITNESMSAHGSVLKLMISLFALLLMCWWRTRTSYFLVKMHRTKTSCRRAMSVLIFDLINCQLFIYSPRDLPNRTLCLNQVVNGEHCSNRLEWFID